MSGAEDGTSLPADLADQIGVWGEWKEAYPIAVADIQRWAVNVYWPEEPPKLFWDAGYAASTRWGGIIAPQEFNPFAWTMDAQFPKRGADSGVGPVLRREGFTLLNGGQSDEFGEIMRPGDVIRSRSRLAKYSWKTTRFGPTLFITNEELWLNQHDETVRRRLSTTAAYRTGDAS
jgi:hypothetical protein